MRARVSSLLILVCLVATLGAAQDRGTIAGKITDEAGAVIPGATVTLSGPENRTAVSNERGTFAFVAVLPGSYQITVELPGFATTQLSVTLGAGQTKHLSPVLRVGTLSETVTVTGESRTVDSSTSSARAPRGLGRIFGGRNKAAPAPPPGYGGGWNEPSSRRRDRGDSEAYDHLVENEFVRVSAEPLSTFSIDVDTASYANVRRFLNDGTMPPAGACTDRGAGQLFPLRLPATLG